MGNVTVQGSVLKGELLGAIAIRKGIFGIREDEIRTICTSHVERHNWTIRTLLKRFTRLLPGFSKKLDNLKAACGMLLAYYSFVWRTRYPDRSGQAGRLRPMAAGILRGFWGHVLGFWGHVLNLAV